MHSREGYGKGVGISCRPNCSFRRSFAALEDRMLFEAPLAAVHTTACILALPVRRVVLEADRLPLVAYLHGRVQTLMHHWSAGLALAGALALVSWFSLALLLTTRQTRRGTPIGLTPFGR